jgi:GTP-binding protein EngB required for normal cell division
MVTSGLAFILAFTKTDTLSKLAARKNVEAFLIRMREITEEPPPYVLSSSKDGQGRSEILELIESAILERSDAPA